MLKKQDIIGFILDKKDILKEEFHLEKIGLFGSFARDDQNQRSDIDIIVEFKPGTQDIFELKIKLESMLEAKFNRSVEICREKYLKSYVKEKICKEAVYVG